MKKMKEDFTSTDENNEYRPCITPTPIEQKSLFKSPELVSMVSSFGDLENEPIIDLYEFDLPPLEETTHTPLEPLQIPNDLKNILNWTIPVTSEILFKALNYSEAYNKEELFFLFKKAFESKGINIDAQNPDMFNCTLLHYSAKQGLLDITSFLLEQGANPNIKDKYGKTPLQLLVEQGTEQFYIAKLLLENGAFLTETTDTPKWTLLQIATMKGYTEVAKLLIDYDDDTDAIVLQNFSFYKGKNLIEL